MSPIASPVKEKYSKHEGRESYFKNRVSKRESRDRSNDFGKDLDDIIKKR